jgi:hypothetical protein
MARDFNGSTDRIDYSSISLAPETTGLSVSCWIQWGTIEDAIYINNLESSGTIIHGLITVNIAGQDRLVPVVGASTTQYQHYSNSNLTTLFSTGTWYHILWTISSNPTDENDLKCYIDGSEMAYGGGQGSGDIIATDAVVLGGRTAVDDRNFDGVIAETGVWLDELSLADAEQLASGASPLMVNPSALSFYAPLSGGYQDVVGGSAGVLDGTSAFAHPRIMRPSPFAPIPSPAKGKIWVNDAASWDAGAVQQTHPGTGWTDTSPLQQMHCWQMTSSRLQS